MNFLLLLILSFPVAHSWTLLVLSLLKIPFNKYTTAIALAGDMLFSSLLVLLVTYSIYLPFHLLHTFAEILFITGYIRYFYTIWRSQSRKMTALLLLLFWGNIFLIYFRLDSAVKDFYSNSITYTRGLGWIDWDHANPASATRLLVDVKKAALDSPAVCTYYQSMRLLNIDGVSSGTFTLPATDSAGLVVAAYQIFRNTTRQFETMQNRFPCSPVPYHWMSSSNYGDLTGNRLSFYCAAHHLDITIVKSGLGHILPGDCLAMFLADQWGGVLPPQAVVSGVTDGKMIREFQYYVVGMENTVPVCQNLSTENWLALFSFRVVLPS